LNDLTDIELMFRVREGDESAFACLYRRHYRRLLNFFYGLSRDASLAEEICLDTFARIWRLRTRYAATGSYLSYMFAFARIIWLEQCRELKSQRRLGVRATLDDLDLQALPGFGTRPDEAAVRSELEEALSHALQKLPEEQRMVIIMRLVERMSLDEIAAALRCPINTVRSRKLLAVKKLRESLHGLVFR
jgi:RNA polymerase sigma-70 factor (ECF subfamily)